VRNPYAKALRVKPQQILRDKREKTYREILDEELERGLTDSDRELIAKLKQ
jgi:hypothetical protein